ncbi:MAG: hypothetical protein ABJP45_01485 [Cyclobacteriaceae bacterium]
MPDPDDPCFTRECRELKKKFILAKMAAQDAAAESQDACSTRNKLIAALGVALGLIIYGIRSLKECVSLFGDKNQLCKILFGAIGLLILIALLIGASIGLAQYVIQKKKKVCNQKINVYRQAGQDLVNGCGSLCGATYDLIKCCFF